MLMIFYFAIPMGSGMGFMVGSTIASLFGAWQWGVRITAILGVICLMLIIVFIEEPERGKAEREKGEITAEIVATSYLEDLKALVTNQTYLFSTAGYTAIVFVVGTLTWWAPTAILHKDAWKGNVSNTDNLSPSVKSQVNLMYGAITCIGGIIGVSLGTILSNLMRRGVGPFRFIQTERSDAIICAVGAIVGVPTLFFGIYEIQYNMIITWILMFICITMTCFNWATNVDMLMAVIIPSRRNSAMSWQILCSHLFGDASGPYILGLRICVISGKKYLL
uniref:MFS domain-containing protein n=1 Tax=Heterorhabditis bacteriophora TaxID=37862 RepID=A0A1I7XIX2_HETBA